jgi:hypothetical protein
MQQTPPPHAFAPRMPPSRAPHTSELPPLRRPQPSVVKQLTRLSPLLKDLRPLICGQLPDARSGVLPQELNASAFGVIEAAVRLDIELSVQQVMHLRGAHRPVSQGLAYGVLDEETTLGPSSRLCLTCKRHVTIPRALGASFDVSALCSGEARPSLRRASSRAHSQRSGRPPIESQEPQLRDGPASLKHRTA